MTEEPETASPPERKTTLASLEKAMDASEKAMDILQEAGDQTGAVKAARAVTDIGYRISRLEPPGEAKEAGGQKQRDAFLLTLIKVLEDPDPKKRQQVADSLRRGLKSLQEPEEPAA